MMMTMMMKMITVMMITVMMMTMETVMMTMSTMMMMTVMRMTARNELGAEFSSWCHCFLSFNRSLFYFDQTLLQECLSPVAEEVCVEIAETVDASDTPLQKLIR